MLQLSPDMRMRLAELDNIAEEVRSECQAKVSDSWLPFTVLVPNAEAEPVDDDGESDDVELVDDYLPTDDDDEEEPPLVEAPAVSYRVSGRASVPMSSPAIPPSAPQDYGELGNAA